MLTRWNANGFGRCSEATATERTKPFDVMTQLQRLASVNLKYAVKTLYKNLIFLGREYPKGEKYFRDRCHHAFMKNKDMTDTEKIKELLGRGEYVMKELEALYMLRKYRALKKRYYEE